VGTQVERGDDGKPIQATTATLEVTPQQAEQLAVAMNEGTIQLVLRGYGDPDSIKTNGAESADVLAQLRSAPNVSAPIVQPRRSPVRTAAATNPPVTAPPVTAPPLAPIVVPEPQKPRTPDSVAVQIFKGDKQEQRKFVKPDSTKIKPATP
jgi:pilus assembly protein CpaB